MTEETLEEGIKLSKKPKYSPYDDSNDIDEQTIRNFVRKDQDNLFFIDMLKQEQEFDDPGNIYYGWLQNIKKVIENGIRDNQNNERICVKYEWLKTYFNSVVTDDNAWLPVPEDLSFEEQGVFRNSYRDLEIK